MSPATTPHRIARPIRLRPVYRMLFKRLKLPRDFVHRSLSALKRASVRGQVRERAAFARGLGPAPALNGGLVLDPARAFFLFGPGTRAGAIPGADPVAARCRELYQAYRDSGQGEEEIARNPNKRFLLSVISGNEFHKYPELMKFMVSPPLVEAASRYLGTVPVVEGAALWWTPPNDTVTSSQQVHVDQLAQRQVKIIMNCLETTAENGPLHMVPADLSDRLRRQGGHRRGRLDDEWLEEPRRTGELYAATGGPGSGIVFDSSRCLHFGSRGNRSDRLVLTFHYLPLDAPTETRYRLDPPLGLLDDPELAPIQRLALGFRD